MKATNLGRASARFRYGSGESHRAGGKGGGCEGVISRDERMRVRARERSGKEEDREKEEGDIPHNKRSPFFRKLIDIFFSYRITPIQPPLE